MLVCKSIYRRDEENNSPCALTGALLNERRHEAAEASGKTNQSLRTKMKRTTLPAVVVAVILGSATHANATALAPLGDLDQAMSVAEKIRRLAEEASSGQSAIPFAII